MGKKNDSKVFEEGELAKIRALPLGKRVRYIIDYYWLWILGIGCALALILFFIYRIFFTPGDYWIYGVFANTSAQVGDRSELWEDFRDYAGYDTEEKMMEFNAASYFDPSISGGTNNSYFQSFVAITEAGDLDFVVMERPGLEALGESGRLLDLSLGSQVSEEHASNPGSTYASNVNEELLAVLAQLREEYGDRFVYCTPMDESYSTEPVPVGIDISDSILMTEYELYPDSCVLGIGAYTKRPEAVRTFLEFLLKDAGSAGGKADEAGSAETRTENTDEVGSTETMTENTEEKQNG